MLRGTIYGLLAAAAWGGMYVVSDVVLVTIPPFTLLTLRLLLGVLVAGLLIWRTAGLVWPKRADFWRVLGVGAIGFGISVALQFVGTDKSTAVNGSLITSGSPAFIVLFAALILREKLTARRVIALLLATLGVIVIIDPRTADFSSDTFAGDVALALAAVSWGLYSVLVRRISAHYDTLVITMMAFWGGLLITIPAALLELPGRPVGTIDFGIILGVLYLGIIAMAAATWWWNRAFALVDASVASLFFFAQPLVGAVLSVLLLGQQMTVNLWIGGGMILVGVLFSIYPVERLFIRRRMRVGSGKI